jgi:hypothetical protein
MADPLQFNVNIDEILQQYQEIAEKLEPALLKAVESLSIMTHLHIMELANSKLHSTKDLFIKNLSINQVDTHMWEIRVEKPAVFIEDGIPSNFSLLDGFLNSPKAKTAKNGNKYLVIPFKHNKGPSQQTAMQQQLTNSIKKEMKDRGIPYGKVEKNPDGSPKMGLLHKFNLNKPDQKHQVKPGQQGPQGRPWQVSSRPQGQEGPGGRPYLWGVRVYQKENKDKVDRGIFTFRTASSAHAGLKWTHPGKEPLHSLDDALKWAEQKWPELLDSILKEINA